MSLIDMDEVLVLDVFPIIFITPFKPHFHLGICRRYNDVAEI